MTAPVIAGGRADASTVIGAGQSKSYCQGRAEADHDPITLSHWGMSVREIR